MQTVLVTIVVFGVVMAAMSLGVMISGRRLRGSCGGTGTDCECSEEKRNACSRKKSPAQ